MTATIVLRTCATCTATIHRSTGLPLCKPCNAAAERAFRATHSPLDADWLSARSLVFGDLAAVVALVSVEVA